MKATAVYNTRTRKDDRAQQPHALVDRATMGLPASLTMNPFATVAEPLLHSKQSPHGKHCGTGASGSWTRKSDVDQSAPES